MYLFSGYACCVVCSSMVPGPMPKRVPVIFATMAVLSHRLILAKVHDDYRAGRLLLANIRPIVRLRYVLHSLFESLGGRASAIHAARFNLIGKSLRLSSDIKFAEKVIEAYDRKERRALQVAVSSGERMALKIHRGDISGRSRRVAGSRVAQAKMTASLGTSTCKTFCRKMLRRNKKRLGRSRLSRAGAISLKDDIRVILLNQWESSLIGKKALKSCRKLLARYDD